MDIEKKMQVATGATPQPLSRYMYGIHLKLPCRLLSQDFTNLSVHIKF